MNNKVQNRQHTEWVIFRLQKFGYSIIVLSLQLFKHALSSAILPGFKGLSVITTKNGDNCRGMIDHFYMMAISNIFIFTRFKCALNSAHGFAIQRQKK